jgi:ferrous iron transport protein A
VECVGESPAGDPKAFLIRGAVIALRSEDSKKVIVTEAI